MGIIEGQPAAKPKAADRRFQAREPPDRTRESRRLQKTYGSAVMHASACCAAWTSWPTR